MMDEKLKVEIGNISKYEGYDAIVISTKPSLKSNWIDSIVANINSCFASLDAQVRMVCGKELEKECEKIIVELGRNINPGEAVVTLAPKINYKYIIHTVVPDANDEGQDIFVIKNCYKSILDCAIEKGIRKIVIPSIGINHNHYDVNRATKVAVETVKEYLITNADAFDLVVFVIDEKKQNCNKIKSYYDSFINEECEENSFFTIKINVEKYNENELIAYVKRIIKKTDNEYSFNRNKAFLEKIISKVVKKLLRKNLVVLLNKSLSRNRAYKIIDKYLNDLRIIFTGKKATIFIDLKNININEIVNDIIDSVKSEKILLLIKNISSITSEQEKKTFINSFMDFVFGDRPIQTLYLCLVEAIIDEKQKNNLKKLNLEFGKIYYSKL